jgi:hypothetical protein
MKIPLERLTGIEPAYQAWEAGVLPLNYSRERMTAILLGVSSNTKHYSAQKQKPDNCPAFVKHLRLNTI